jgi:hypothetical protein
MFRSVSTAFAEEFKLSPAAGHHYVPDGKNWVDKTEFDEAKPPAEMAAFRAAIARRENGSAEWNKQPATASVSR